MRGPAPQLPRRTPGRTVPGRLRALDRFVALHERGLIARTDRAYATAPVVDVGVGEWPWTTLETAKCLQAIRSDLKIIGVELDPDRLRHARRYETEAIEFRAGGFELPLTAAERPRLVRAVNLLRGYGEAEAQAAHLKLGAALLPGGLLLEGSSSHAGGVLCVHLLRRLDVGLAREGLLFATDFSQGFAPVLFRDRLPRDLRRHCRPGTALHTFFAAWTCAFDRARESGERDSNVLFVRAAERLGEQVPGIVSDATLLGAGALLWQPPGGVPRVE